MSNPAHQPSDPPPNAAQPVPSDQSLLRRFRQGKEDAATALYLRYAKRLRGLAVRQVSPDLSRRIDPDDIVQSVFRTFFRRAAAGQYNVPDGEELWKLFLVIALNKVRAVGAYHRAAKRDIRSTKGSSSLDELSDAQLDGAEALGVLEMVIDEHLQNLPVGNREIIELRIKGHEVSQIADRTGRAKRSIERVLHEFRKHLAASI